MRRIHSVNIFVFIKHKLIYPDIMCNRFVHMSSTCFSRWPLCIICWFFEFMYLWIISNFHIECLKLAFWFLLTLILKKKILKESMKYISFLGKFCFLKDRNVKKTVCIQMWLIFLWMGISFQKTVIIHKSFLIICCNKENYIEKVIMKIKILASHYFYWYVHIPLDNEFYQSRKKSNVDESVFS